MAFSSLTRSAIEASLLSPATTNMAGSSITRASGTMDAASYFGLRWIGMVSRDGVETMPTV